MTFFAGMDGLETLSQKVGSPRQVGSVRRIVLQDGPEHGLEAIAFSTAGQLQFWAFPGRALDIGPVWFQGMPMSWEHPTGYAAASLLDPESDHQSGIERLLSGFLVTCGLENTRRTTQLGPQHGRLPSIPARLTACGEAWDADAPYLFAEGETVSAHLKGACYRVRRRIEAPVDGSSLTITDIAENIGTEPLPLHILYHFNVGYPFVNGQNAIILNGEPVSPPDETRQGVSCLEMSGDGAKMPYQVDVTGGAGNHTTISFEAEAKDLPFLQIWRDPRPRRNILSIEPANTNRAEDGTSIGAQILAPGQKWTTALKITFTSGLSLAASRWSSEKGER